MWQQWSERPRSNKWMTVGTIIGFVCAALFALEYGFFVRIIIMIIGCMIGAGVGIAAASLTASR